MLKMKTRLIHASRVPVANGKQADLVWARLGQGACIECGSPLTDGRDFCRDCMASFPRRTQIGEVFDAWLYAVDQIRPAIVGFSPFHALRLGVGEREKQFPECICVSESFEEAEAKVEKERKRARRFVEVW